MKHFSKLVADNGFVKYYVSNEMSFLYVEELNIDDRGETIVSSSSFFELTPALMMLMTRYVNLYNEVNDQDKLMEKLDKFKQNDYKAINIEVNDIVSKYQARGLEEDVIVCDPFTKESLPGLVREYIKLDNAKILTITDKNPEYVSYLLYLFEGGFLRITQISISKTGKEKKDSFGNMNTVFFDVNAAYSITKTFFDSLKEKEPEDSNKKIKKSSKK